MENVELLIKSLSEEKKNDRRYMVTIVMMVILCAIFGVAAEHIGESPVVAAMPLAIVIGALACWSLSKYI